MAEYYRIKGWAKYQYYKDRNPPWIKVHRELLTSRTWAMADDASRVLAIACMLLAAATDNQIPADPAYVKRVAYLNEDPDFSQLLKLEFLELVDDKGNVIVTAITPLADASKMQAFARPETEAETYKPETEKKNPSPRRASAESVFSKAYSQYYRKTGRRKAEKAWAGALARGHDEDFVYQRVMQYTAVCLRANKEKQYTPHMATWLNDDRFMDDPSEWAVERTGATYVNKGQQRQDAANDAIQTALARISGEDAGEPEGSVSLPGYDAGNSGDLPAGNGHAGSRSRAATAGVGHSQVIEGVQDVPIHRRDPRQSTNGRK